MVVEHLFECRKLQFPLPVSLGRAEKKFSKALPVSMDKIELGGPTLTQYKAASYDPDFCSETTGAAQF